MCTSYYSKTSIRRNRLGPCDFSVLTGFAFWRGSKNEIWKKTPKKFSVQPSIPFYRSSVLSRFYCILLYYVMLRRVHRITNYRAMKTYWIHLRLYRLINVFPILWLFLNYTFWECHHNNYALALLKINIYIFGTICECVGTLYITLNHIHIYFIIHILNGCLPNSSVSAWWCAFRSINMTYDFKKIILHTVIRYNTSCNVCVVYNDNLKNWYF
jgi:hypothetical protein